MKLSHVNLTPTMQCNLKCELCGVLVPHYDYRPKMSVEEFSDTLKVLFQLVDRVERLQITGGEALLHPELDIILAECFRYGEQFDELWFFSNCAVPFRPQVLDVFGAHKDKVVIHCSDYGVRPEVAAENNRLLEEYGLRCKYLKYYEEDQYKGGWVDNGDFVPHNRTEDENTEVFASCSHVRWGGSWYIRHGQMHWCGRSIRGTELGKIPLLEKDYLDIFDANTTLEEKREKLELLSKAKCITACDYCNGHYGTEDPANRRPAGEQM